VESEQERSISSKAPDFASFNAIVSPSRPRLVSAHSVSVHDSRAFQTRRSRTLTRLIGMRRSTGAASRWYYFVVLSCCSYNRHCLVPTSPSIRGPRGFRFQAQNDGAALFQHSEPAQRLVPLWPLYDLTGSMEAIASALIATWSMSASQEVMLRDRSLVAVSPELVVLLPAASSNSSSQRLFRYGDEARS
jgi:hypothetical protein